MMKAYLTGRVATEPVLAGDKRKALFFRIACRKRVRDAEGGWRADTCFFSCVVFGKRAEGLSGVLAKGMPVSVDGTLRSRARPDGSGGVHDVVDVVVDDVEPIAPSEADA